MLIIREDSLVGCSEWNWFDVFFVCVLRPNHLRTLISRLCWDMEQWGHLHIHRFFTIGSHLNASRKCHNLFQFPFDDSPPQVQMAGQSFSRHNKEDYRKKTIPGSIFYDSAVACYIFHRWVYDRVFDVEFTINWDDWFQACHSWKVQLIHWPNVKKSLFRLLHDPVYSGCLLNHWISCSFHHNSV